MNYSFNLIYFKSNVLFKQYYKQNINLCNIIFHTTFQTFNYIHLYNIK